MGVISGIGGAVDGVDTVRDWNVSSEADLQSWVASNTQGGTGRSLGNKDWSGTYNAYGHTPVRLPGEKFTFTGSIDGTNGVEGEAIVDQAEITVDIEAGAVIAHTVNFSADGELTLGAAAASDSTTPDPPSSIGTKVELGTVESSPTWTELDDVRTVTITITANNQSYVSSGTSGHTKREKGAIDLTFSIDVYTDDFDSLPAVNETRGVRVYVNDTEYWLIEWGIFGEASDLEVDIEGQSIVGATLNGSLAGFQTVGSSPTVGKIVAPDGTQFWPESGS